MKRYIGKVALITGATRGIGRAVAEAFAEEGSWVALAARSSDALKEMVRELSRGQGRAIALPCDVTRKEDVEKAIDQLGRTWGKLDILVNNAGVSGRTPTGSDSDELWQQIVSTNLTGCYRVTNAALELMNSGRGRIVNISSVLGRFGVAGYSATCTSKHGVIGLTRALALELAPRGITVNAICPGWVPAEMTERGMEKTARAQGTSVDELRERALERIPLRRFIEPQEIAHLVLYLASEDASGITGQAYNLCGGQSMD